MRGRIDGARAGALMVCAVLCVAVAGVASAASGGGQSPDLLPPVVSSLIPSPVASLVPQATDGATQVSGIVPTPVQNTVQTLTNILPSPLQSLLPDLTSVLPGSSDVTHGAPSPTSAGSHPAKGATHAGTGTAGIHGVTRSNLPAVETGSVLLSPNGGAAGRALRLAGPMSAPVAAAIMAFAGIAIFSRSRSAFQVLEHEKEAVGGWTVIRL